MEPELLSTSESLTLVKDICRRAVKSMEMMQSIKANSELSQVIEELAS